jgi:hypothetical protein
MKLRVEVLPKIDNVQARIAIASALGVGEAAVKKAIKRNSDVLTKYAAVEVIKSITGITADAELFSLENTAA